MRKKILAMCMTMCMAAGLCACDSSTGTTETEKNDSNLLSVLDSSEVFADGDFNDVTSEKENATITLSGSEGTISDTTRGSSGSEVVIRAKGIYRITGSSEDVSIVVNDATTSGNIYLLLDGVTMTNAKAPCIIVEQTDKVIIQSVGENNLTYTAAEADQDGAIYAEDDITVNGPGTLNISSKLHGIVAKDKLKITGSTLNVNADSIALKAKESLRIGGGEIALTSGHDAIQVEDKKGDSTFHMEKAALSVNTEQDGISVGTSDADFVGYTNFVSGTVNIVAGGGASNAKSDVSQKGIKCDGRIFFHEATLDVSSADDAVHSGANVEVDGATMNLATSDDAIHADSTLDISSGTIDITQSYEGLEAYDVNISGGDIKVISSDDGISVAGGSDSSSDENDFKGMEQTTIGGALKITDGNVYVNAGGDGIDSNGSLYISGGQVIVEGPENDFNGALDKGDTEGCVAEITGGTVLAIGASGMAINFDSGSQCSALVALEGKAGSVITVDDGSDFSFTATKSFQSVVYSSPNLKEGSSYAIAAGDNTATADFSSSLFFVNKKIK